MSKKEIDPMEFTRLYNEGIPYRQLARKYGCGLTKIQLTRAILKLPVRKGFNPLVYTPKEVDEKRFRELYESGFSYLEIGKDFGITTFTTISRYVKIFGLPKRDRTLSRMDTEKFKKLYNEKVTKQKLMKIFGITEITLGRVIKELGLPVRKRKKIVKPKIPVLDPIDDKPELIVDPIDEGPKLINDPVKTKSFFTAPTLRQIQKEQLKEKISRIEREQKTYKRKDECI